MTTIDHERCSELLLAFMTGELSGAETDTVGEHLSGCEQCRAEQAGLEALRVGAGDDLSTLERGRLHQRVAAAIEAERAAEVIPLQPRRSFGAAAARFLGAAAAITAIGTFIYFGATGGGDDASRTQGAADNGGDTVELFDESEAPQAAPEEVAGQSGGGGGNRSNKDKATTSTGAMAADTGEGGAPRPPFEIATDPFTSSQLERLGRSSAPSRTLSTSYNTPSDNDSDSLLDQLVAEANDKAGADVAQQVENCAARVLESEDRIIPTFGALGELDGRDTLVVGFAWARSGDSLDSYMVWAWEQGDCDVTLEYIEGRIKG